LAFTKTLLPLRRHLHPGRFYCRTLSHPVHLEPCALFLHLVTLPPPPPPPIGKRSIVMCVSVCVFVCPRSYLRNCTSDLHQIFVHVTGGFKGGGKGPCPQDAFNCEKSSARPPELAPSKFIFWIRPWCMLPMAVARSYSGHVVIRYVLPVLWMTSCLLISQGCSMSTPR